MSRYRVWTFILYPESMNDNFYDILDGETNPRREIANVPFVLSPLHDKDIAGEGKGYDGTKFKKPHYHAMIMFSNVKTYKQVSEMVSCLTVKGTSPIHVSMVHSTQAMVRYFIHADHKDKAQYQKEDIKAFNGADVDDLYEKNDQEINGILKKIIETIEDNDITEYSDLVKLCLDPEYFNDWFSLVSGKYQFFLFNYLKSKHFKQKT